jgi:hypothetical protein
MTGDPIPQHLKVSDRFPSTAKLPSTVGVVIGSTADEAPTEDGVGCSVGGHTAGPLPLAQPDMSTVSAVVAARTARITLSTGLGSGGVGRSRLMVPPFV